MAGHPYPYLDAPTPLAFAHRGGASAGDENTAAAFARCVELGYRYVETDVHATSDGVAVVFHDETLGRMTGDPRRVRDVRWADLAAMRVGGEAAVPRLDDVLGAWPQVRFNIDLKSDQALVPGVEAVRRVGALDRVLLASFSDARLRRVRRELGPGVATSMGTREVARLWTGARLGRAQRVPPGVVAAQVPVRQGRIRVVTPRFLAHAHRIGLQVHVWTIDDPTQMHELLDLGVDGIMTDRIEVLRDVYRSRGLWAA
ncbi:glycerophosphodiester phosphodiesterase [Planosporangium mesophilum]|uniref:Glycerophosphoryl diester phosphodiesterase n=1 Tax=Planosporangium mesophilum TaxID=689768 RepID=A0A8J3X310_9ACTN|nr:glycerophosphodiester phosphodiesterase [Planosporangium mesophilum]NJC83008.1 glycerophosphodiester phosphodiesterase [Planosporangium mesophilum]GII22413.1 glycerophosphoryl diester phosphodiesterase [Planosporangium mesophilum]